MPAKAQNLKKAIAEAQQGLEPGAEYGEPFASLQKQIDVIVKLLASKK